MFEQVQSTLSSGNLFRFVYLFSFSYSVCFCLKLSRRTRKPTICSCENKDADQLRGDQRLCFRYTDSTIPLLLYNKYRKFKLLACFFDCTARFVSDLVGIQIVGFPTQGLNSFLNLSNTVTLFGCFRPVCVHNLSY